jgi:HD-GYP domain-containing protein (c-di-GMP phosphodiesterase class II)
LPGVRSHHERYDGKGYPDGTKGEDTPLFGRIIAVADAFDAMTSDRPYRRGMPVAKALSILSEGRATQWDPVFAELFITWATDNLLALERTRELAQVIVEERVATS